MGLQFSIGQRSIASSEAMNFYPVPPVIQAKIYVRIPNTLRCTGQPTEWRGGSAVPTSEIFLEGPTYVTNGDLYLVDVPYGRILKVNVARQVTECARWDGEPNGLAVRKDGCLVVADYKQVRMPFVYCVNVLLNRVCIGTLALQSIHKLHIASTHPPESRTVQRSQ